MAEMLLKKYGGERYLASSAGLFSFGYSPMTPGARDELLRQGIGLNLLDEFYSRKVSEGDMASSDIVVGVTPEHAQALAERFPQYAGKIKSFPLQVANAYETEESYHDCCESIKANIFLMFGIKDNCITIRKMDLSGASNSAALEAETFSNPWKFEDIVRIAESDGYIALCAYYEYEYAGFVTSYAVLDEGNIISIATVPKFRKRGVATALIGELSKMMKSRGVKKLMLEAREKNAPARSLYEKIGFETVGTRKNYYENPQDNAVLYTLSLAEKDL